MARDESPPVALVPDVQCTEPLPEGTITRIEKLTVDACGRLHAVFLQAQPTVQPVEIVGSGVLVSLDASQVPGAEAICQTVTSFAETYPLRIQGVASPSTRTLGAAGRSIWIYGSDAGVVRVAA